MIDRHEADLLAERSRVPPDEDRLDQSRYQLQHLYGYYQGIQDAIATHVRQQQNA